MTWEVEYTDPFGEWWSQLNEEEQDSVASAVRVLQMKGPNSRIAFMTSICEILKRRIPPMAKSFKKLLKEMSPERRKRIETRAGKTLTEINLRELRQAFALTQQQLADTLKINQAAISKMESQSDMYLSTLRRVLEAMGARLKIVAEFPGGNEVVIDQFAK